MPDGAGGGAPKGNRNAHEAWVLHGCVSSVSTAASWAARLTGFIRQLDEYLLKAFIKRATEAGVSFESVPVALRTIKGGQPPSAA
jgi:hypothetical protein